MPKIPERTLAQMEQLLIALIPREVKAAADVIDDPVYCMRIWYNGTDSDEDAVPYLMFIKESTREAFLNQEKARPVDVWLADEWTNEGQNYEVYLSDPKLEQLYGKWYDYLASTDEEEEDFEPFRAMLQRVSKQLNKLRWADVIPVTDDFVVFPADGSHVVCDDFGELLSSITPKQRALLEERGLLPGDHDDEE